MLQVTLVHSPGYATLDGKKALLDDERMRTIYEEMSQSIHEHTNKNHDTLRLAEDTSHRV